MDTNFEEVVRSLPDAFSVVDRDWRIVYVNDAVERTVGRSREELVGRPLFDVFPETRKEGFVEVFEQAMRDRVVISFSNHNDAWDRYFENQVVPFGDGIAVSFRDVTDRVREAKRLEESERKVTHILESIGDGFVVIDLDWRYTYVNHQAAEMFGRTPEDLIGKSYREEYPEAIGTPFEQAYARVMETGEPEVLEDHYEPWDRWFENRIHPTAGGGIAIYFSEITERKRAEEELGENAERLGILHEMDAAIAASGTVDEIVATALKGLTKLIPHDGIGVGIWDIPSASGKVISAGPGGRLGEWTIPLSELPAEVRQAPRGSVINARDLAEGPSGKSMDDLRDAGMRSAIFVSMWADEERSGDVWACSFSPGAFTEKDGQIMREVADRLALAVRHTRLREVAAKRAAQAEREAKRVEGLNRLGRAILSAVTPKEVGEVALDHLARVVRFDRGSVVHYDLRSETANFIHVSQGAPLGPGSGESAPLAAMLALEVLGSNVHYIPSIAEVPDRPAVLERAHQNGLNSFLGAALRVDHEPLGLLAILSAEPDAYSDEDIARVRETADILSIALRQELTRQALGRQATRLEGLNRLDRAILGSSSPSEMAHLSLQHLGGLLDLDRASVWEMSEDERAFTFLSVVDPQGNPPHVGDTLPLNALGPAGGVLSEGAVYVDDLEIAVDHGPLVDAWVGAGFRSLMAVRLSADDRTLGGMFALSRQTGGFEKEDLDLLREVGAQVSIGMRQAQMGRDLAERARRLDGLARERGRLLEGLVGAQEEERARVARELHDGLGQTLTSLGLLMADLERDARGVGVKDELARFSALLGDAVLEMRHLVAGLRPVELESGLASAIARLLAVATEGAGVRPALTDETDGKRYPGPVEATVFRVVQEAVTNAVKHASPSGVSVVLAERRGRLSAIVEDDGDGFDPEAATGGYGLLGMRERAAIVGGELTVESSAEAGTTVRLEVPV